MNQIITLPKTAHITWGIYEDLIIKNHKVQNSKGLLGWALDVITFGNWQESLSQMISQGVKFGAFIAQCVAETKDYEKFARSTTWCYKWHGIDKHRDFTDILTLKEITNEIGKMISICKNWDQFYSIMNLESNFQKKTISRIAEVSKT